MKVKQSKQTRVYLGCIRPKPGTMRLGPMTGLVGCVFYLIFECTCLDPKRTRCTCCWPMPFFNLYVGLHGPGWLYVLGMLPRGYLPLWTPRARATDVGQSLVFRGVPCVPRSRELEKRPAAGREKNTVSWCTTKTHVYIVIQGAHEGNPAVVTAYLLLEETWSKNQQDRSSCWLLLFTLNILSYSYSDPAE